MEKIKHTYKELEERVYNYPTKHKLGFTSEEIATLYEEYPELNKKKAYEKFLGDTCALIDGEAVHYHCDVHMSLVVGFGGVDYNWD